MAAAVLATESLIGGHPMLHQKSYMSWLPLLRLRLEFPQVHGLIVRPPREPGWAQWGSPVGTTLKHWLSRVQACNMRRQGSPRTPSTRLRACRFCFMSLPYRAGIGSRRAAQFSSAHRRNTITLAIAKPTCNHNDAAKPQEASSCKERWRSAAGTSAQQQRLGGDTQDIRRNPTDR